MKRLLFITTLILTLSSCRKDDYGSDIQFGNYSNMDVTVLHGRVDGPFGNGHYYTLDVNYDGVNDLSFYYEAFMDENIYYDSDITCLHDGIELSGYLENDTTYLYMDTTYEYRPPNPFNSSWVVRQFITSTTSSCTRKNENDVLVSIDTNHHYMDYYQEGEYLNKSNGFYSKKTSLIKYDVINFWSKLDYYPGGDTVFTTQDRLIKNCNALPYGKYSYIGFKILEESGDERFGWVMSGMYVNNDARLFITETAISKK